MAEIDLGLNIINLHGCGGGSQSLDIFDENGMIKADLIPGGVATSTFVLYMSTNEKDTPKDISWVDENGVRINGTLVANESTMGTIYFVLQNKDVNAYNQYATFRSGVEGSYVYEWRCIGNGIYDVKVLTQLDDRVGVIEENYRWKNA